MALPLLVAGRAVLDIGTGVGLPGLPLALARPARPTILVEPRPQCIGLIHWLLDRLPPLNVTVRQSKAQSLNRHTLPPCQVVTRAALDWSLLASGFSPDSHPILRWSGDTVENPPARADWVDRRCTIHWNTTHQEIIWWGPDTVFHVKQNHWNNITGPVTVETTPR